MIQSLITLDAKANENSDILFIDINRVALMITIESKFIEHSEYYSGIYTQGEEDWWGRLSVNVN